MSWEPREDFIRRSAHQRADCLRRIRDDQQHRAGYWGAMDLGEGWGYYDQVSAGPIHMQQRPVTLYQEP